MPQLLPRGSRTLLDTNVLVYLFDRRSPKKAHQAQALIAEALDTGRGIISYQVVQEFLNVARRKFLDVLTAREAELFLHRVLWPLCDVLPDMQLYATALSIADETGWTFYDSLIVSSAARAGCSLLFSEDLQAGRVVRGVEIQNPFE